MKSKFLESLDVIESLLETIGWLGGDSYEMECIESDVRKAGEFLDKHKPKPLEQYKRWVDNSLGIYTTKDNKGLIIRAKNRRNAKNILKVRLDNIKCIKVPKV